MILQIAGFSIPVILAGALTVNKVKNQCSLKNYEIIISLASLLIILMHIKFAMLEFMDWRFCFTNKLGETLKQILMKKHILV